MRLESNEICVLEDVSEYLKKKAIENEDWVKRELNIQNYSSAYRYQAETIDQILQKVMEE